MSWKPVVNTKTFRWVPRTLTFGTQKEARDYGADLKRRWDAVTEIEIIKSDDRANYRWDGKLILISSRRSSD